MKKFKIIFLLRNNGQNTLINNIIKNLKFNNLEIEIIYTNQTHNNKNIIFSTILNLILFIEKKFLTKNEIIIKKKGCKIKKFFYDLDLFEKKFLLLKNSSKAFQADVVINLINKNVSDQVIKFIKFGIWNIDYRIKNYYFIGFWECFLNFKVVKTQLIVNKIYKKKN